VNAIEIDHLTCGYDGAPVIKDVSLDVPAGDFLGILGPNGSGKTTLLRALSGIIPAGAGRVTLNGADLATLSRRDVARRIACVMQDNAASVGSGYLAFSVRDVVAMGRTPYLARTGWETGSDRESVEQAMSLAEVAHLADRAITELSGGERQRTLIAMALAQECEIVMLDEPTNHLDVAHQLGILNLFAGLNRDAGTTIIGVFHDLNLAAEYCERIVLLKDGGIAGIGSPAETLTAETIQDIYGASVAVQPNPATGRPHVFLRRG
jgi:iron complex transport system ATP-binding protein